MPSFARNRSDTNQMRIMFLVQGDGRGHMTQAISAAQILERQGHQIVAVTVGTNPSRTVPEFFTQAFGERLKPIASPGFSFQSGRGVALGATLRQAICGMDAYRKSLGVIAEAMASTQPELILNFLEPLAGVFNLLHPHPVPVVSIGHQFMLRHPEFVCCAKLAFQQWTMRQYVALAGARSTRLALSFYPAAAIPRQRLFVCPPLLRSQVFELTPELPGRFLLAYVLNQGYAEDILRWHAAFPDVEVHCFCEKPKVEPVWRYDATLSFHKLDGAKFLKMMAQSRGVACTAGFESLSEAAWLGKRLLVVPVANHVEQHLNALDAQKAGLAVVGTGFDLTPLLRHRSTADLQWYRTWVSGAASNLLSVIDEVSYAARAARKSRWYLPTRVKTGRLWRTRPAAAEARVSSAWRQNPAPALAVAASTTASTFGLPSRPVPESSSPGKSCDKPLPAPSACAAVVRC
jgi:uncharacterized protein (TIGR00661 family)